ncbi:MAG: hypothetical protein OHK0035_18530 [Cyanobacteria bacterium J069]
MLNGKRCCVKAVLWESGVGESGVGESGVGESGVGESGVMRNPVCAIQSVGDRPIYCKFRLVRL